MVLNFPIYLQFYEHPQQMWDMCQMLNIWHISHTKQENQIPIRYCKCCKIIPFVFIPLQICNGTDKCGKPKIITLGDKTFFCPYIFTRFSLWSLTFFFTTFSLYPEKRVSFQSLTLHQRRKLHRWQTKNIKNIKIIHSVSTWLFTSTPKLKN